MAAKLELTFHSPGPIMGDTIHVKNNFTFVNQRQNAFEVSIEPNNIPTVIGPRFRDAFNADVNYLGEATVIGRIEYTDENMENALYILTITHPNDEYFDLVDNRTSFITHELTIIEGGDPDNPHPGPVGIEQSISQSAEPCRSYILNIESSRPGHVRIEFPAGHEVDSSSIDESYSIELARPVSTGSGTIKFYDSRGDSGRALSTVTFSPPPILHINEVYVLGSPFGANATVDTENGLVRQYSLDGQSWQGSPQFFGITAGDYTAYVRDQFGCTKTMDFEVLDEHVQGLTAPPFIRVPIHNSVRFAKRDERNFLGLLSGERTRCYYHEYLSGDRVRTQFKSSYANNRAFLISENSETEIPVIQKSSNINRVSTYEGNYREVDGRLAIYFTAGEIYNPDSSVQGDHLLSGRLPLWYGRGVYVDIEGIGPTQIERLHHDQAAETTYAITQMDARGSAMNKKITSIHSAHPYEVFEFEVEFVTTGTYQIRIEYENSDRFYLSELIRINENLPEDYKVVQWLNTKNNDIIYNTGIRQFRRLEIEKDFTLAPRAEKETYSTDTSVELVNSKTFAVYPLILGSMPMEVARGVQTGLDNSDTIVVDGAVFVCESPVTVEEDGLWLSLEAELTLTDQTITGQQNITDAVDAEFLLIGEEGVAFLKI